MLEKEAYTLNNIITSQLFQLNAVCFQFSSCLVGRKRLKSAYLIIGPIHKRILNSDPRQKLAHV